MKLGFTSTFRWYDEWIKFKFPKKNLNEIETREQDVNVAHLAT